MTFVMLPGLHRQQQRHAAMRSLEGWKTIVIPPFMANVVAGH